jgi:hypothetical protein
MCGCGCGLDAILLRRHGSGQVRSPVFADVWPCKKNADVGELSFWDEFVQMS